MRLQRIPMIGGMLVVLVAMTGCAGTLMFPTTPLNADLRSYSTVVFSAESRVAENAQNELTLLKGLTTLNIKKLNAFQSVRGGDSAGSDPGTLFVKATVVSIRKVSSTDRFWLGAFAGRATMTMNTVFIDAASGKQLGAYSITGQSGLTGYSGGMNDAVRKASKGIVDILSRNYTVR